MEYEIELYETVRGKCPFSEWLEALKDRQARVKIRLRLERLSMGNFGQCEPIGNGISELKVDFGPGYRIYFNKIGKKCVLLLIGGSKRTQSTDIEKAKTYLADYKTRQGE